MLENAFSSNKNLEGVILHSDQGWQYQHPAYNKLLNAYNITVSMSRKGNSIDNAMIESFFGTLKSEMFYGEENTFKDTFSLERAIDRYIEYYNNKRIKLKLKGKSPLQYRAYILQYNN